MLWVNMKPCLNWQKNKWKTSNLQVRKKIAPLAAGAAWGLGEWDEIEKYISVMKENSPDKEFF